MYNKVYSSTVIGIDGVCIGVEADVSDGLPMFSMVGYLSSSVKEAGERVKTSLRNSGFFLPPKRITVNLSPGNIRKYGTGFDLPIAVSILLCLGITPANHINIEKTLIIGELGLDGSVKPINGILPMVYDCKDMGFDSCIIPIDNVNEAKLVKDIKVYGVRTLREVADFILGIIDIPLPCQIDEGSNDNEYKLNFSEIKGQASIKRGMEIAAAGFHNVLMSGSAGAGKSMIAKRLPTIMPAMSFDESVDVTKIYSVNGYLNSNCDLISKRPFRSPHHTITGTALVGGGMNPRPGEVSMAHNGVLFLDELPEFNKNVLEMLRQPIEDKVVNISRVNSSYIFPSDFMLVAAMNPCPCGFYPDIKRCTCSPLQIKKYQSKISGPLLDRIDICMQVNPVELKNLFDDSDSESSEDIRKRVEQARLIQNNRYKDINISFNSQLDGALVKKYIKLDNEIETILMDLLKDAEISARGFNRILKLARTIADLDNEEKIQKHHIIEAFFYRNKVMKDGSILNVEV